MIKPRIYRDVQVEYARCKNIATYVPKISDFIIWHGFVKRWYGIIMDVTPTEVVVVTENLPKLLLTMPEDEKIKRSKHIPISKIRSSRGGEWHVLQDGVWHFDD
jgi:hypothetical protein